MLRWWEDNRRDFAWRGWNDPYRLLVAEVLLRQTHAVSVADFIPSFLASYPDAKALSLTAEAELVSRLQPLGLSRQRATQLLALARHLQDTPTGLGHEELLALPGIGRYSAGMVAAVMGASTPAVDTNVARVICRIFALEPSHAEARKSSNVWAEAEGLIKVSGASAAHATWAILDLADAVCHGVRAPSCMTCPLKGACEYGRRGAGGGRRRVRMVALQVGRTSELIEHPT